MNKLVSVIIPTYNAEKFLAETISSVLNQTYSDLEVIIVDDGSTDNTFNVAERFTNDPRVKILKQKNQGVSAARNSGYAISKGEFISYLDADDVWMKNTIELWIEKFKTDEAFGIVHSDSERIDSDSNKLNIVDRGSDGYLLDDLLLGKKWVSSPSGILVKKEVIDRIGGFDAELSTGADTEFLFRVASKYKIGRVSEITWYYRMHSSNMHSNLKLHEKDALIAYKRAKENKLFKNFFFQLKCFSNMYFMLAGSFWKYGNNKIKSVKYLTKSIIYFPPNIFTIINKAFV